jgi:hypothetical protein
MHMVQRRWDTTLLSTTISTIHSHYFSIQRSPLHRIASHRIVSYIYESFSILYTKSSSTRTQYLIPHTHTHIITCNLNINLLPLTTQQHVLLPRLLPHLRPHPNDPPTTLQQRSNEATKMRSRARRHDPSNCQS